jgi:hypothetical protein
VKSSLHAWDNRVRRNPAPLLQEKLTRADRLTMKVDSRSTTPNFIVEEPRTERARSLLPIRVQTPSRLGSRPTEKKTIRNPPVHQSYGELERSNRTGNHCPNTGGRISSPSIQREIWRLAKDWLGPAERYFGNLIKRKENALVYSLRLKCQWFPRRVSVA